jgi:hypothetical protein
VQDCDHPTSPAATDQRTSDRTGTGNGVGTSVGVGVGVVAVPTRNAIHFEGLPLEETLSSLKDSERNVEGETSFANDNL